MNNDEYRALRQLILDLAVRVEEIDLHLKRQDDIATHRARMIYEWCAPAEYKVGVEALEKFRDVDVPEDLRKIFDPKT